MARESRRYSRTPEAVEAARRWFAAEIEHERAHRSRLEARPREDFALDGYDPEARRREMIHETDERIAALQKLQRQLGRRKTVRIPYRSLDDLVRKADDAVLADMFLGLEGILRKAVERYPTESQLRDALAPDEWFEMRTMLLCHGTEDVFVRVPRPTTQVPGSALRSDAEYIAALRLVYADHASAVRRALAEDEVMEALFDDAPDSGGGPCKAATIALHFLAGLGVRTIFDIRQRMGLLSYSRPMPKRKRRDRDGTRS